MKQIEINTKKGLKTFNSTSKVADWYKVQYPTDTWAYDEMDKNITFNNVVTRMRKGEDIYEIMKVDDSIVRERVFQGITEVRNLSYNYLYNLWLYGKVFKNRKEEREYKEWKRKETMKKYNIIDE